MGVHWQQPKPLTPPRVTRQAAAVTPLPVEEGLYYRTHHKDAPFGREHAQTRNIGEPPSPSLARYWEPKPGYSAFWHPHHLDQYHREMGWDNPAETRGRRVLMFRGNPVGEGADGEPAVMPHSDKPEASMSWGQFRKRLEVTPEPGTRWDSHTWGEGPNGQMVDDGYRTIGGREAGRWQPSSGIFGPTTGLDPDLFDGHGKLRPGVRQDVMERLDRCIRTDSGLAGSDWQGWTRVYLLGGSVSEWAGPRPNGTARDLDVIVAVDLRAAQGHNAFEGMDPGTAASALNAAFHRCFNDDHWRPSFGGTWALTAFCNQRAWDVTAIRPYAAYDLTHGRWAVRPPHLPGHSVRDFDPAVIAHAQAVLAEARAVLRMAEPLRSREARDLWEHVHAHRCAAFSQEGTGWDDPGNVDEKALAYAPRGTWAKIRELALGSKTAAADDSLEDVGRRGYCTEGWGRWQQGMCGTYATALTRMKPDLKLGEAGYDLGGGDRHPAHFFAHDETHAYDAAGRHPLPYHGVHGDMDYNELHQEPDWFGLPGEEGGTEEDIADAQDHARRNRILEGGFGPKTAAAQGYLRNPYHGTPEFGGRAVWSHTWFHGTRGEPDFGTRRKYFDEAQRAALPPEQRKMNSGWTQPNQHLGIHFSPLHEVGHKFAPSTWSGPTSIAHARLRGSDPAHFETEDHLNIAMADWAQRHYPHWHDDKLNANAAWNYSDQEGTHRDFSQVPDDPGQRWRMSERAQSLLTWHPHMPEILSGFKAHLRAQGHHGITYGNGVEGPYDTDATRGGDASTKAIMKHENWPRGAPKSISAIADPEDIEVTHVEHIAGWRKEPEGDQRTWEDASDSDEPDDMRDRVLKWHREQGGKLPGRTAAYVPASATGYGASRPRGGFGKGREHWSQPPEQRAGQPGEYMYRFQPAEYHDQTMREGIAPRQSAGHLPDDPDETVYMTADDHVFHARPEDGHPGTPEWLRSHGDSEYHRHYKIDVSGLPLVEDRTYTNPQTGQKRAWMATGHIGPERIQSHLPGSEHGVTYDLPGGGTQEWTPPEQTTKTAVRAELSPWMQWAGGQPHKAVIHQAQGNLREQHPELTEPLDRRDPDDIDFFRNRDSEAGSAALRAILRAAGHPGADSAWVAPHPDPRGSSQVAVDADGNLGAVLLPSRWDRGTVAHEGAHLAHAHQSGIDLAAMAHGESEGGEIKTGVPDHVMHGPDFARHYANALDVVSPGAGDDFLRHHANAVALIGNVRHRFHGLPREFEGSEPIRREAAQYLDESGQPVHWGHADDASSPGTANTEHETWYHLTDNPHFHLDPEHAPADNSFSIEDRSGQRGIYLGKSPEHWFSGAGEGYARPYLAEFHVHPSVKEAPGVHGRWGGEMFVPAEHSDKLKLHRLIPIDAYARENYGTHGWIEQHHGSEFDTGKEIERPGFSAPLSAHYPFKERVHEAGTWRYPGPDVRDMTPEQHNAHRDRWLHYLKHDRGFSDEDVADFRQEHDKHLPPRIASAPSGVSQRPRRTPGNAMVYLDVPHGTVQPYAGQEGGHHIALAYLPRSIGDEDFARVVDRAREAATRHAPMKGVIGGHMTFPPGAPSDKRRAAVVPADIPGVHGLQREFGEFDRAHYEQYTPHVTRAQLTGNDPDPEPHPPVRVPFTHVHVRRGDEVHSFPLTGPNRVEAAGEDRFVGIPPVGGRRPDKHRDRARAETWQRIDEERRMAEQDEDDRYAEYEQSTLKPWAREAVSGYDGLTKRSGMIYLDLPPGTVRPVPGGVDASDQHVTVCYLGADVDDHAFSEACRRAEEVANVTPPLYCILRGVDSFPPSDSSDGKVPVFVPAYIPGIGKVRSELEDLSASEHKDYQPHVTTGYFSGEEDLPEPQSPVSLVIRKISVKRGDDVVHFPFRGQ